MTSLYFLLAKKDEILRHDGPSDAQPKSDGQLSFSYLAVAVLNSVLRPVLATWHPLLLDYENAKSNQISASEHEKKWDKNDELRNVLKDVRLGIIEYANFLAQVADVPSLIIESQERLETEEHC